MEMHEVKILEDIKKQHPAIAKQLDEADTLGEAMVTLSTHLQRLERQASMKTERKVLLSAQVPESLKERVDIIQERAGITKRLIVTEAVLRYVEEAEDRMNAGVYPLEGIEPRGV